MNIVTVGIDLAKNVFALHDIWFRERITLCEQTEQISALHFVVPARAVDFQVLHCGPATLHPHRLPVA